MNVLSNPVFHKEVISAVRVRQHPVLLWTCASLIGAGCIYCYWQAVLYLVRMGSAVAADCWSGAVLLQTVLLWLICPALAANAITREREQQTWEMLVFTLLRPSEIIVGKLVARYLPAAALQLVFLPITLLCLVFNGALPLGVFMGGVLWLFSCSVFLTTAGMFFSYMFRKTASALACSYLVVFVLLIGLPLLTQVVHFNDSSAWNWTPLMWLSPIRATNAVLDWSHDAYSIPVIGANVTVFLAVSVFLVVRMVASFRRLSVD